MSSNKRRSRESRATNRAMDDLSNALCTSMDLVAQVPDDIVVKVVRNRILKTEPRPANLTDKQLAHREAWSPLTVVADEDERKHRAQIVQAELAEDYHQAECLAFKYLIRYNKFISDYEYLTEHYSGSVLEQEKKRFRQHIRRLEQSDELEEVTDDAEMYLRTFRCTCVGYESLEEEYIGTGGWHHAKAQMRMRTMEMAQLEPGRIDGDAALMARKYWENYGEWPRDFQEHWSEEARNPLCWLTGVLGEESEQWTLGSKMLPVWVTGESVPGIGQPSEGDREGDAMDID